MKVTRKVGRNKERPRVWLEVKVLEAAGFKPGDRYNLTEEDDLKLKLKLAPDGKRKVSGKGTKPIVDILGKALESGLGNPVPDHVEVRTYKGTITLVGTLEE